MTHRTVECVVAYRMLLRMLAVVINDYYYYYYFKFLQFYKVKKLVSLR